MSITLPTVAESILINAQTVLQEVNDPVPPGGDLFANVYRAGQEIDRTDLPYALIHWGEDSAQQVSVGPDGSSKISVSAPLLVSVEFVVASATTAVQRQLEILGAIIDALHDDRTRDGNAIDSVYVGGGLQLSTRDEEVAPSVWMLQARFATSFRFLSSDPGQVV